MEKTVNRAMMIESLKTKMRQYVYLMNNESTP